MMAPLVFGKDLTKLMCWTRAYGARLPMLLTALLIACSSTPATSARDAADANDTGRKLVPTSESERALLKQLSGLPNGKAQRVGDATIVAEPPYHAASGHLCRALSVTAGANQQASHRLACSDGQSWFFVPDVFGANVPRQ